MCIYCRVYEYTHGAYGHASYPLVEVFSILPPPGPSSQNHHCSFLFDDHSDHCSHHLLSTHTSIGAATQLGLLPPPTSLDLLVVCTEPAPALAVNHSGLAIGSPLASTTFHQLQPTRVTSVIGVPPGPVGGSSQQPLWIEAPVSTCFVLTLIISGVSRDQCTRKKQ